MFLNYFFFFLQAHEKMFDITNHQENIGQNYNKLLLHICQNGYHQKEHK